LKAEEASPLPIGYSCRKGEIYSSEPQNTFSLWEREDLDIEKKTLKNRNGGKQKPSELSEDLLTKY
jgi:hypothetical protein